MHGWWWLLVYMLLTIAMLIKYLHMGTLYIVERWRMYAIGFCSALHGPSQAASSESHGGIKGGLSSIERWRESSPCIVTGL